MKKYINKNAAEKQGERTYYAELGDSTTFIGTLPNQDDAFYWADKHLLAYDRLFFYQTEDSEDEEGGDI